MASAADRANSLAAKIAEAIASEVTIDHNGENGAATLRIRVPDGADPLIWGHIQSVLMALPAQDTFGSLRSADGAIHLWATLRDPPDGHHPTARPPGESSGN